jgi:glycosyltransferase involved in cell wall biosynthesis
MAERLEARGINTQRVTVIPNWTNDEQIHPIPENMNPLRREWSLEDKFMVGYSGNLGWPHEFDTVLTAAELLKNHRDIVFLVIGGGHRVPEFMRLVQERGLSEKFQFFPYQELIYNTPFRFQTCIGYRYAWVRGSHVSEQVFRDCCCRKADHRNHVP